MTPSREASGCQRLDQMSSWNKVRLLLMRCEWLRSHPPFLLVNAHVRTNQARGHIAFIPNKTTEGRVSYHFTSIEQAHDLLDAIETFFQ